MRVEAKTTYSSAFQEKVRETDRKQIKEKKNDTKTQELSKSMDERESIAAKFSQKSEASNSSSKIKSSSPDESVGQLASMLARAETRMDVQQVASKAMRALTNLRMCAAASEGKEAKKIAQQIRRMEKLIKRIQKKMQHLSKEEQLEYQRKRAEKKMDMQKVRELSDELNIRRNKRRKDERRYALRELAKDRENSSNEIISAMAKASSSSETASMPDFSAMTGMDMSSSLDISV